MEFGEINVQLVGTKSPNGIPYNETELNLSGGDVNALIAQLCGLGFSSNGQCSANNTPLIGAPHTGFTGNFRSPGLTGSVQVNTNALTGQVQIDVDPFNPAAAPVLGPFFHGVLQVLPNKILGPITLMGATIEQVDMAMLSRRDLIRCCRVRFAALSAESAAAAPSRLKPSVSQEFPKSARHALSPDWHENVPGRLG